MRLRNKKTGEIIEIAIVDHGAEWEIRNMYANEDTQTYNSLAELNEEWTDAPEEPKEYWCIRENGVVGKRPYPIIIECVEQENRDAMREIGNYFETEEEAELAVRKLKAWKRLKDKGMSIYSFKKEKTGIDLDFYTLTILAPRDKDSLDLLFSGEYNYGI